MVEQHNLLLLSQAVHHHLHLKLLHRPQLCLRGLFHQLEGLQIMEVRELMQDMEPQASGVVFRVLLHLVQLCPKLIHQQFLQRLCSKVDLEDQQQVEPLDQVYKQTQVKVLQGFMARPVLLVLEQTLVLFQILLLTEECLLLFPQE